MSTDTAFSLPLDAEQYTALIISRCEDLASTRIWAGLDTLRLRAWLANFKNPLETYFAACILDRLLYRSRQQTSALVRQLFQRTLPDLCRTRNLQARNIDDWIELLNQSDDPGLRLVPVIRDIDPPTKSGPLVARLFRRTMRFDDRWTIWPWQIERCRKRGIRTFVFIDDFLGTGHQFRKFVARMHVRDSLAGAEAIYAPLMA